MQIQYLVELVGALLSANANAGGQRRQTRLPGVTVETVRTMKESGMIAALTNAAGLLDLDHPKVLVSESHSCAFWPSSLKTSWL